MADWYMDPAGDDGTGDGSSGNPYLTISKCHTEASDGDTIIVNDGTYTGGFTDQVFTKGLTIQAANNGLAILDGAAANKGWSFRDGTSDFTLTGLTITNVRNLSGGATMKPLMNWQQTVYTAGDMTIEYCTFHNLSLGSQNTGLVNDGLMVYYQTDVSGDRTFYFNYNLVYDTYVLNGSAANSRLLGIHGLGGIRTLSMDFNTIYLPSDDGSDDDQLDWLIWANNILTARNNIVSCPNANVGFNQAAPGGVTTISNNCWHGITSPPGGTGDITSDPLFVDPLNVDFNLRPSSPCINTGVLL